MGSLHLGRFLFFGILLLVILFIWNSSHNDVPKPATSSEAPVVADPVPTVQDRPRPTIHKIGEDFTVGYWSYRCNGATWQPAIVSLDTLERPDAEFLVVSLYIRNNDRTSSTFPPLKLIDPQGREYDESSKGSLMAGRFDTFKQLNPGVSSQGYVVFDVPNGQYSLQVSGGFESGEHALVDLSAPAQANTMSNPDPTPARPVNAEVPMQTNESAESTQTDATASPLSQLEFGSGVRLFIDVVYVNREPDGNFTFIGRLAQPVALVGGGTVGQGTKVSGSFAENSEHIGHVTVSLKEFTSNGEKYDLQASSAANQQSGTGPGIESARGGTKVLEMWFSLASVYEH